MPRVKKSLEGLTCRKKNRHIRIVQRLHESHRIARRNGNIRNESRSHSSLPHNLRQIPELQNPSFLPFLLLPPIYLRRSSASIPTKSPSHRTSTLPRLPIACKINPPACVPVSDSFAHSHPALRLFSMIQPIRAGG